MLVRQLVSLELLDSHNVQDWGVTKGISYPLENEVVGVSDLKRASVVTKARAALRQTLSKARGQLPGGRGNGGGGGNGGSGNSNSQSNNSNSSNNSNNSNNNSNNNSRNGGRGGRQAS